MSSHDRAKTYPCCIQISRRATENLFGKLASAGSQALIVGKAWVNNFFKNKCSEDQDDDDDFQAPDPLDRFTSVLANIDTRVIQEYASCIRRARMPSQQYEVTPWTFACTTDREPLYGSSNILIPLRFGDGVQWLFKVPSAGYDTYWNDIASRALTSEVSTMRILRQSGLPVPEIYSFEASIDSALGCPFILMEHMRGRPVHEGWFDDTLSNEAKEQFRQRCLQTLALNMRKLSTLKFAQAGTLNSNNRSDGNDYFFQPIRIPDIERMSDNILEWRLGNKELDDGDYFLEIGPFDSDDGEREYLMSLLDQQPPAAGKLGQGIHQLLRLFMEWMPQDKARGSFVISHPDLDLQNVLVDESGTVTGLIDWDGVSTMSHLAGCTYPKWLTHDWDPWNYAYRSGQVNLIRGRVVPSPRELKKYRELYAKYLEQASTENGTNGFTTQYVDTVRKSLLLKSLELAIKNPHGTDGIILKIFKLIAQISGQVNFRLDHSFISQVDESRESCSFESGRVLANNAMPKEGETSSATSSGTYQSAKDDDSRHTRDSTSTPPTEMSSKSSIESDDEHMDSARNKVTRSTNFVTSKGRQMRSGLQKFIRVLSPLRKSRSARSGDKGAPAQSIMVDNTLFDIVSPPHTASNDQIEDNSLIDQIQQASVDSTAARDVSPNTEVRETNSANALKEIPSSIALSAHASSLDLKSAHNHSTNGRPVSFRAIDATGARPRCLGRPSKCAREIPQLVSVQPKDDTLKKDPEVISTAPSENAGLHEIKKSKEPRHRRRLAKKQNSSPESSTSSASESSSSSSKSRTKRVSSWLKSVVYKNGPKDYNPALSAPQSADRHPSDSEASVHAKKASTSTDGFNEQVASSNTFPPRKESLKYTESALGPAGPSAAQNPGPQTFDLDNLELIDDDRLWDEGFLPIQVCHDLVDGTLDEARMRRLRTGFEVLLNSL